MTSHQIVSVRFIVFLGMLVLSASGTYADDVLIEYESLKGQSATSADADTVALWRERRIGLFVHWGPSANRTLSHSHARRSRLNPGGTVDAAVYDRFYEEFNPTRYDPIEWAELAKQAGARYLVFTAKHHDGFSMFDSAATDYDIMNTPFKKDVCAMLAQA
jgi:alpha-L-fucosidase